ncbi:HAD-IA family hydrolase [Nereida sp. MMG025]|uniref:HAD-IA family hydrolase n=1 Tax=Nereida sp. MMG025 TaxID=2909981 RepID=UPI001EFFC1BD|nr:HAD-IA family hydrolase [Nereida sp. MMG025]MCF6445278.1 HAD-IA family hydrolase [Nereida sp. MMG025]
MARTVIFDLDGTLADTSGDLIGAANACFRDLGLGDLLDPARDAGTALRGGRAMLKLGFSRVDGFDEGHVDAQYQRLLDHYARDIDTHTYLYDGAMDAVETLKTSGYRVGICTNKPEGLARTLLTRLQVLDAFHSLIGADTLPTRKPDPAPFVAAVEQAGGKVETSVLIGDTQTDRSTSANAGVPSVLVTFGPGSEDVVAMQPEALLADYRDLPSVVAALIG